MLHPVPAFFMSVVLYNITIQELREQFLSPSLHWPFLEDRVYLVQETNL